MTVIEEQLSINHNTILFEVQLLLSVYESLKDDDEGQDRILHY